MEFSIGNACRLCTGIGIRPMEYESDFLIVLISRKNCGSILFGLSGMFCLTRWSCMGTSIRSGLIKAAFRRAIVGFIALIVACFIIFIGIVNMVYPPKRDPFAGITLLLLLSGMISAVIISIFGIGALMKALKSIRFIPSTSPEKTSIKFLHELFGGMFLPNNPALAFMCLSDSYQEKWGDWKLLRKAARLYHQSLKQKYNEPGIYFDGFTPDLKQDVPQGFIHGCVHYQIVVPPKAGGTPRRIPATIELALVQNKCCWYVDDSKGGFNDFAGMESITDFDNPNVRKEIRVGKMLLWAGYSTITIIMISIITGILSRNKDVKFISLFIVPFFLVFVSLGLIIPGRQIIGKYKNQ